MSEPPWHKGNYFFLIVLSTGGYIYILKQNS